MKRPLNTRPLRPPGRAWFTTRWLALCAFVLAFAAPVGWAQRMDTARTVPPLPTVALDSVAVAPQALDTKGWLLLNPDIKTELDGAVHNLYNFKFDKAERQFRSLKRRYPQHPMPYFGVLVTTGRKITLSPKSLFISTFCRRIEKRSFYKASMEQVKSDLYGPPMRLFVLSH